MRLITSNSLGGGKNITSNRQGSDTLGFQTTGCWLTFSTENHTWGPEWSPHQTQSTVSAIYAMQLFAAHRHVPWKHFPTNFPYTYIKSFSTLPTDARSWGGTLLGYLLSIPSMRSTVPYNRNSVHSTLRQNPYFPPWLYSDLPVDTVFSSFIRKFQPAHAH